MRSFSSSSPQRPPVSAPLFPSSTPPPPAIVLEDVQVVIGTGANQLRILSNINLTIPPGTVQLLMGPSGSGKTTLLSVAGGLLTPTLGRVYLLGRNITAFPQWRRTQFRLHHIGFIFQDFNLFPALSAVKNVEVVLNLLGQRGQTARQQALELLEAVELKSHAHKKPRQLSGGQQQRVAIARAMAAAPQLILADEPTATLDSRSGRMVMDLLCRLARDHGCTVLMVTHDPRIVDIADRITYIEDGMLKPEG